MRDDVGGLEWGRQTNGRLTWPQRGRLAASTIRESAAFAVSRSRLALGRSAGIASVPVDALSPPDSELVRRIWDVAVVRQSPAMLHHALRTHAYGLALAGHFDVELDPELFWCAALLHDVELERPVRGSDFALRGAETAIGIAESAEIAAADAFALADAICRHTTPRVDPGRHPASWAIAAGATADLAGYRQDLLDPTFVALVLDRHERLDIARLLGRAWRAEARACPGGRAAVVQYTALLPWIVERWNP